MTESITAANPTTGIDRRTRNKGLVLDLLMILVLLGGVYFRFVGIDWGEYTYMHPDERFLVWVTADIAPVQSLSEYFDTANSTLNPNNRGHGFYVYGTLPIFLTRYLVEWVAEVPGWNEILDVGRPLSALSDLLIVVLIYWVAARLYDKRVGLLAGAFYAFAVLPIQLSHYYKEDTIANFFNFLAIYFAVRIFLVAGEPRKNVLPARVLDNGDTDEPAPSAPWSPSRFLYHPLFFLSVGFGIAFGSGLASKLSIYPVAAMLPAAFGLHLIQLPQRERQRRLLAIFAYLVVAGAVSLLVFRLFQPYAFSGPGFLGVLPNPQWVANIREQRLQAAGDVDFPPALQWARRPIWFSGLNLAMWGLGLPLGLLALVGFLWAGWQMLNGHWKRHTLLWGWTAVYFTWQSLAFNPTMRYQLPVYPTLVIFAAWAVVALYDRRQKPADDVSFAFPSSVQAVNRRARVAAFLLGGAVLLGTFAWAFAFTRIYTRPFTRVEASRWVYQNIPGPINLQIDTGEGALNQPVSYPTASFIRPEQPFFTSFQAQANGELREIYLAHVADLQPAPVPGKITVTLSTLPGGEQPLADGDLVVDPNASLNPADQPYRLALEPPAALIKDQVYYLTLSIPGGQSPVNACGPLLLHIQVPDSVVDQSLLSPAQCVVQDDRPLSLSFTARADGILNEIHLNRVAVLDADPEPETLQVVLGKPGVEQPLAAATLAEDLTPQGDPRGQGYRLTLDRPVSLVKGEPYLISLSLLDGDGAVTVTGAAIASESTWDDGLLRLDGYDPYSGIYQGDLNFEMYWDDNADKLARFVNIMDKADVIYISSNRQWATTTRVPERYPLTSAYYRHLLGCPAEMDVIRCYNEAEAGTYQGNLGFELVKVVDSSPNLGPLKINTQYAEEAFTVYDHPKVFIFQKTAQYDSQEVRELLSAVDLSQAVHITPRRVGSFPANLMLPASRWAEQVAGGTWSNLFDTQALQNRFPFVGVIVWYLSVGLLGLVTYPLVRMALPGLADRGYPLARTAGLLLLSYLVWLGGSFRIPFNRPAITAVLGIMILIGAYLAYRQRSDLRREWAERRGYFLLVEGLFLAFFLLDLLIRYGNPDLWHPAKGGEKPMDFSYFNAILKSTSFPPYDPWYAGGYINYYYYGFVFVGVLVKWLGIVPAVAYNLILPTIFALIALGAFSLGWNLYTHRPALRGQPGSSRLAYLVSRLPVHPGWIGLAAALGMAVLGNLGILRMLYRGYQMVAAPGGVIEGAGLLTRLVWAFAGFLRVLTGASLPYGTGDWYWLPSRAIPAPGDVEPITEFPFFTVLYGDPHAHLFALPITLLALSFALSIILARGRWHSLLGFGAGLFFGGLAIGALRPTNTPDFYLYLPLGLLVAAYALWSSFCSGENRLVGSQANIWRIPVLSGLPMASRRFLVAAGGAVFLGILSLALYQPFAQWYGLGYSSYTLWKGTTTPTGSYLMHWGLFLFVIVSWMAWETRDWMASTPVSALRKLAPYKLWLQAAVALLLIVVLALLVYGVNIAWLVLPLAAWAGVLILRPDQPDVKRFVLFLVGTGLVLTLVVEVVVFVGDIGRMNTVFKLYLQVWTLFAISSAAALGWLLNDIALWFPRWRLTWQVAVAVLVFSAALYPVLAGTAKVKDRMAPQAPHTLDGMAFMAYAEYAEEWGVMDLSQDYNAIRWMQENVAGSPVIVEANLRNLYRWGSRFSIYTGLPGVVGWEWHQQQQRALLPPSRVSDRIFDVDNFYLTTDLQQARDFLRRYGVRYIVLGQQERGHYPGPGLDKFQAADGVLWREVFRDGETVIYEVIS